jgi:hypothetical protein
VAPAVAEPITRAVISTSGSSGIVCNEATYAIHRVLFDRVQELFTVENNAPGHE